MQILGIPLSVASSDIFLLNFQLPLQTPTVLFPQSSETTVYCRLHLYTEDLRDVLRKKAWYILNLPSSFPFFQESDPF